MDDPKMLGQASQIWSMLDDMAENNPSAYRKFIDKQLKEGRELNRPPQPHMCVQTCVSSTWVPVFINICSWTRITKPKDDSAPIPVFGTKLKECKTEEDGEHFVVHIAFHPNVLEQHTKSNSNKEEEKALINLSISYIEDQNKVKLSTNYYILESNFKGDPDNIREEFGLAKDPMKEDLKKLAKSFASVANIATSDPGLIDRMTGEGEVKLTKEETTPDISIPGITADKGANEKRLIEEVKTTPKYTVSRRGSGNEGTDSIIIKVDLEKVEEVQQCILDVTHSTLELSALDYFLHLELPEAVNEAKVKAKFNKSKHQLTVTLPTVT